MRVVYNTSMNFVLPGRFVIPEVVSTHFHLKPGERVADLGAGGGFFLKPLSAAVGPEGKVYAFEIKETALQEINRVLRPGGVLHIIDWTESFGGLGPQPKDVITQEQATALCEAARFIPEREYPAGDHHYGIAVRKV